MWTDASPSLGKAPVVSPRLEMVMGGLPAVAGFRPSRLRASAENMIIAMVFFCMVFTFVPSFFGSHTGLPV